jgi:CO/xanthine dehydrogenase FAD-binding subunit
MNWLGERASDTVIFAGGTDLMPRIRHGLLDCRYVIDVSRLDELKTVVVDERSIAIGAGLTYSEIIQNREIIKYAPVLAYAARCVGSEQVRNVGTLGGNVANASPAADSIPALMVHNAQVEIMIRGDVQIRSLPDVVLGTYYTSLRPGDLITKFFLEPLPRPYGAVFQRIARRKSLSIARINLAAAGCIDSEGLIRDVRLSLGSVSAQPYRATAAENFLKGKKPHRSLILEAATLVSQDMVRRSGVRPSTDYKRPAAEGLVLRSLVELFEKCGTGGEPNCK